MREVKNIWREELEKTGWKPPDVDKITRFAADIAQPYMMECVKCQFVVGGCQFDMDSFFYKPKHCIKILEKQSK